MLMCWEVNCVDGRLFREWEVSCQAAWEFEGMSMRECVCVCVCACASCLCGQTTMGLSDGSHVGSCHGNRGCRLVPPDLSCPRILQTSLFSRRSFCFYCFHFQILFSFLFISFFFTKTPAFSFPHLSPLPSSISLSLYILFHFPKF